MNLRQKQSQFALLAAKFIQWLYDQGYEVTFGETWRPEQMQQWYFDHGLSKTLKSQHMKKLAIDLNIFINGELTYDKKKLQKIGNYWESLHPKFTWGGNFGMKDTDHFQMND